VLLCVCTGTGEVLPSPLVSVGSLSFAKPPELQSAASDSSGSPARASAVSLIGLARPRLSNPLIIVDGACLCLRLRLRDVHVCAEC
jgi:hypothetical protein